MAFQSPFSSVKVVVALGKFNSGKQQQFSDFAIWRLQHFVEKRDCQIRKSKGEGGILMQKMKQKSSSSPYLIIELAIFRLEFCNFAPMQCAHDEQSALHTSANDPYSL